MQKSYIELSKIRIDLDRLWNRGGVKKAREMNTWCGRKVMRLATLCTNRQCCCLPLHMAVRLTPAVDSVQV